MNEQRIGADELNRLQILESLRLLDTAREDRFDRIVARARTLFEAPVAFISLLDVARQWFKSADGIELENLSREVSFCDYVVTANRHLVVEDLLQDPVLKSNPLVVSTPRVRFYAGVPLRVKGQPVGTLAVLDSVPRRFDEHSLKTLETLACWAEAELQRERLDELNQVLDNHRARYMALFEESPMAIQLHSPDGTLVEKNAGATLLWSVLEQELHSFSDSRIFPNLDFARYFREAAEGRSRVVEPFVHTARSGRKTYLRAKLQPLLAGGKVQNVVVTFEDITDTCVFEETQREIVHSATEREARLQRAKQDQENFYAILAHEMRNPLTGILGIAEIVARDPSAMTTEMAESLHVCADTLSGLIDDTLDIERIAQGRLSLQVEPFSLQGLLESLIRVDRPMAQAKGLVLDLHCSITQDFVRGDRRRVSQILANLISNAIKYTAQGAVTVMASDGDGGPVFQVSDSGEGIAPDRLEQVFLPFFQVQDEAADSRRGLGLGLSIVKNLVSLMGGKVSVSSVLGQGSSFEVSLPLAPAEAPQSAAEAGPLSCHVLVVDDNPVNQRILALQLRSMGCQATLASDGLQALELLRANRYDLVLMDCHMPRMDGYTATREIRANPASYGQPLIVALTASATDEARERCLEVGMNDYLKKPIRHQDLQMALRRNLEKS